MNRRCDKCKTKLKGKKGHGFPSISGRSILCGFCAFPSLKKEKKEW